MAENGIEGYDALTGEHAVGPFLADRPRQDAALFVPPSIALVLQRGCKSHLALLVPLCTNGRSGWIGLLCSSQHVPGAEDVERLETGGASSPRWATSILKCLAKLAVVQVLDFANGQDANIEAGIIDNFMAELRSHGEPVKNQSLNILQNALSPKG